MIIAGMHWQISLDGSGKVLSSDSTDVIFFPSLALQEHPFLLLKVAFLHPYNAIGLCLFQLPS